MWKCEECGYIFDEPKIIYERHPYGMGYATEEFAVCPCCKSTSFEEYREETDDDIQRIKG